jgi:autotransporter-associated beta strand protein
VASGATYDGTGEARSVNILSGDGNVINGSGLSVQSGAFGGVISGAGDLSKVGAGTLTLFGANIHSGLTTVQGGTLELGAASGGIGSSSGLNLYGGSTFRTNGQPHSLDGKILSVRGENATYDGALSALGATLNFIAPVNVSQPMLNVTGSADISNSAVNVGVTGGTSLPLGTQLTLIQTAPGGLTANNLTQGSGIVEAGVTTIYNLSLRPDPASGLLRGTVSSGGAAEQAKALSEGFLSGAALLNQGADLVAGQGMAEAVSAARRAALEGVSPGLGFATFGTLSGGWSRYNSGSHVDMSSLSLLAGLSWGVDLTPGHLTLGAFFEYGNGSYDT